MALDKVTTGIIADNAVSTAKVADDAVTGAKIENNPTVAGNLTVTGTSTLTGNATASGNLTVTGDIIPSAPLSHRNVIYNGDCRIAQRGTTSTNPTSGPNTVDGFRFDSGSAGNATCTRANVSGTNAPGEFAKSFKVEQTTTVAPGSTGYQQVVRKVEAFDCQQFNATTGTTAMVLSFWVKANYADTFSTAILNIDGVRIVTYEYTTVADEWQKVTHAIPADSGGGSYDNNNDRGVEIRWWLTAGSNYIGGATTSWKANSNNNLNVHTNPAFSTDGREWEITGVQLEKGGSATPFEHKSYAEELAKCMRYFQKYRNESSGNATVCNGWAISTSAARLIQPFPVWMRVCPSLTYPQGATTMYLSDGATASRQASNLTVHSYQSDQMMDLQFAANNNDLDTYRHYYLFLGAANESYYLGFDAEIA